MSIAHAWSRQLARTAWSNERLLREHSLALGHAIEHFMSITYTSHLQSYLSFCKLHNRPIIPTIDTLSFYVVFMCHHINPKFVTAYLSGICNSLEPHFPDVRKIRLDPLVVRMLAGMKKLRGGQTVRHRCPLTKEDLIALFARFGTGDYDDCLFLAIVVCIFHVLLRVGELTEPDQAAKRSFVKTSLRNSLKLLTDVFSYHLPYHKGDWFYQGNIVMVCSIPISPRCPVACMTRYVGLRDTQFVLLPELWLTSSGEHPSYSWVISCLRSTLDEEVGGHSLHLGGATSLVLAGVSDNTIQSMGCWTSDMFQIYI